MEGSLTGLHRGMRRRLVRLVRRSRDTLVVRRASAILMLARGGTVSGVARDLAAARSSAQICQSLFPEHGEPGLFPHGYDGLRDAHSPHHRGFLHRALSDARALT